MLDHNKTVEDSGKMPLFFYTGYLWADKPREFEGRALISRQAANLSSKKIAN